MLLQANSNFVAEYDSVNSEEDEKEKMIDQVEKDMILESPEYISGKQDARYMKHCAFSIQPQNYPNAINYVSN